MSHFNVLVVGDNVDGQLAPYQENNNGDCPREFLEFNDMEKEYREKYENETSSEFYCASSSSWGYDIGKKYFDLLKKGRTGKRMEMKITKKLFAYVKRGEKYKGYYVNKNGGRCRGSQWFEVTEILHTTHPDKDVCFEGSVMAQKIAPPRKIKLKDMYDTFEIFMKDHAGYEKDENGRYGYWENPNKKWDWYLIGGRWTGFFKLKRNPDGTLPFHRTGKPGLMTETAKEGYADQAHKKDIDFKEMRDEAAERAAEFYDKAHETIGGRPIPVWDEIRKKHKNNIDRARKEYNTNPVIVDLRNNRITDWADEVERLKCSRERYIESDRKGAVVTFAVVKDGKWYERGRMGWWGLVSDEKDKDRWVEEFDKLLSNLPEDTLLTVVDCHI